MSSVLLATLIVVVQTLVGAVWWRVARGPSVTILEAIGMGMALGTGMSVMSGVLLFGVLPLGWAWSAPAAVTIVALPFLLRRDRTLLKRWRPTAWAPALVAMVSGAVLGLGAIAVNLRNYPLTPTGDVTTYHPDMLFFEALSTSLANLGPWKSIFMSGADIRYHWFTYAWSGQLAQSAGTEPFVVLTRVLPVVALVGSVLIAVAWTQRLTRGRWAPTIAVVLIVFGGYVGATYGTILNFDSPSQSLTTVWMLGLCVALLAALGRRGERRTPLILLILAIVVLSGVTTGGKISSAIAVVGAWLLVSVIAMVRREPWRARSLATLVALLAAFGAVYVAFIAGSSEVGGLGIGSLLDKASSVQGLNPSDRWWGVIAGTLILAIAVAPRWAGVVWLVVQPRSRWRPLTVFSVGLALTGVVTLLAFSGGLNDSWFALAASAPLSVASAVGLSRAVQGTVPGRGWRPSRPVVATFLAAVLLGALVLALWWKGPGGSPVLRWLGPIVAIGGAVVVGLLAERLAHGSSRRTALALSLVALITMASLGRLLSLGSGQFAVQPEQGLALTEFSPVTTFVNSLDQITITSWTGTQREAAQWLKDNARADDLVMTNSTYTPLVPALTSLPTYISGIQYQAPYGRPDKLNTIIAREAESWAFVAGPSAETMKPLCDNGISWVWADPHRTGAPTFEPFATTVLTRPDVVILRVNPSACA